MLKALKETISEYDINLLSFVHHNRIFALDSFFISFSFATSFVSISLILLLFAFSINKKSKPIRSKAIILTAAFILSAITSLTLKNTIYRERPFVTHPFIEKLSDAGNSSFPSGHTLEAFAMATAIAFTISNRKITILIFLWAFLVAYSRMILGVHYPSDILGGLLIGSFIGWAIPQLIKKYYIAYEKNN